eukprot:TRINITY_DN31695_c0_g1_i1.p1 TRINITY_DN31695_c0_g1~~TRINITY_DN31695_c0_g1_i1.p1  ORF type:complete len:169 (-),score=31.35 TRINITY_DN31695_c0_g1_i1:313-819(-)
MASSSSIHGSDCAHRVWGNLELVDNNNADSSSESCGGKQEKLQSLLKHVKFHDMSSSTGSSRDNKEKDWTKVHVSGSAAGDDAASPQAIPTPNPGSRIMWSAGAAGHDEDYSRRTCKPCAWNWKPTGCVKGQSCDFCHMCDEGELKRKKQLQRIAQRKPGGRQFKMSL